MTRKSQFGTFTRVFKQVSVAVALLVAATSDTASAMESNYKVRIHKNFMKQVLDKNFPVALRHIEAKTEKNVFLTDVNANIDNLKLQMEPISEEGWDQIETDLFFDQGQVVMEINGLQFVGEGTITDPQTGMSEEIQMSCKIDLA